MNSIPPKCIELQHRDAASVPLSGWYEVTPSYLMSAINCNSAYLGNLFFVGCGEAYLVPRPLPPTGPCDCDFSVGSDKILRASMMKLIDKELNL